MSDQQQRTQWALDMFHSFVLSWTPPSARPLLFQLGGDIPKVLDAIKAIAPTPDNQASCLACAAKDRAIQELSAALDELTADYDRMAVVLGQLVAIEEARR